MQTPAEIATEYLAVWNEPDAERRLRLLDRWSPDLDYHDPMMRATGRQAMAQMIGSVRERFAGMVFDRHGTPDGHGPFARFSWVLRDERGAPAAFGTDIVRLDHEGRIAGVIGFLDEVRP